jgi:hypothetical protein
MNRPNIARFFAVVVVHVALLAAMAGSALAQEPPSRFIPCTEQSAEHSPAVGPIVSNPDARPPESRCQLGGQDPVAGGV